MNNLKTTFEKVLSDLYTIDWSETDGRDIKVILKTYFDDIPNKREQIKELIINCNSFNKFEKMFTTELLEECC
ncbi:MAG: hypothetical protein SPE59_03490 [Treponema sp.]|nr:hypothetical protein [Treponema sp.]